MCPLLKDEDDTILRTNEEIRMILEKVIRINLNFNSFRIKFYCEFDKSNLPNTNQYKLILGCTGMHRDAQGCTGTHPCAWMKSNQRAQMPRLFITRFRSRSRILV